MVMRVLVIAAAGCILVAGLSFVQPAIDVRALLALSDRLWQVFFAVLVLYFTGVLLVMAFYGRRAMGAASAPAWLGGLAVCCILFLLTIIVLQGIPAGVREHAGLLQKGGRFGGWTPISPIEASELLWRHIRFALSILAGILLAAANIAWSVGQNERPPQAC